jgi:hypothetical protein
MTRECVGLTDDEGVSVGHDALEARAQKLHSRYGSKSNALAGPVMTSHTPG